MESFERAHVVKKNSGTDFTKKKKQIRQMLNGYKQNDNDLIKHSDVIDDGSSSVSGFSDLNLTGSSNTDKPENITDDMDEKRYDLNSVTSVVNDHMSVRTSISNCASELSVSDTESDDSHDSDSLSYQIVNKMIEKQNCELNEEELRQIIIKSETKKFKKCKKSQDGTSSPPFVSIIAKNMLDESFESLVGDYRHSTVKNLPWDSQNLDSQFQLSSEFNDNNDLDSNSIVHVIGGIDAMSDDSVINLEDTVSDEAFDKIVDNISEQQPSVESMDTSATNPARVYYGQNTVILVLTHPVEIYIHGKVEVTGLGGSVEIFGYLLQDKPQKIYAPNYNYAHCLKTVKKQNIYYGLFGKLTASGLTVADAEEIVTSIGEYDGVICLKSLSNSKLSFIENNFTAADLFSKPTKNIDQCFKQVSQILGCSLYLTRPWKYFKEDPKWHEVLKYDQKRTRGIVCGGKGIGKSNFLRYFTNNLLANGPVLVIDLDPGQAEFTVAGNVSATVVTKPLIGPAFTHLKKPELAYNLGMINTMDNPNRYLAAVDALITYCSNNKHFQNMPWIVNTMGMVNGLGLKFISYIILRLSPTFLLQMDSNQAKKFECHLTSEEICRLKSRLFKNLDSPNDLNYEFILATTVDNSLKNNSLPPKDERYLNFLAYFAELIKASTKKGLLGITPYKVSLHAVNVALNVRVNKEDLGKVLCGKIVALCEENTFQQGKVFTLSDKPIPCHGHGLIRGIDCTKWELYVVTPVPVDLLQKVNTIIYADWVPEIRGQEKYLPEGMTVPYRTCTEYQQRQLMFPPRRRFNPIQLLKMSRNS